MGQGGDARRELAKLGLATSAEKHATARGARRGRGPRLDHRDAARSRRRLERVALAPALHADHATSSSTRRGWARRSGSSPTRAPSRRWSRKNTQGQPAARGAAAGDHARGERLLAAHRIVRQRHRPDADAGQDRQALRERRAPSRARLLHGSGEEPRDRLALPRLPVEALRRGRAAGDRRLQRGRGRRSTAGWASAATWRWTSSWRRSRTTRRATTPSACSPRTSPTPGSTASSRSRRCRSLRAAATTEDRRHATSRASRADAASLAAPRQAGAGI